MDTAESSSQYIQPSFIVPLNVKEDITFNFNVYHKKHML